ncbi:hypothetical protein ACTD5D_29150 [Nocardia takedensis]|uniref:hypothetical protein n=1 Tax=Nocardia takedensis TaxID=259390 RepID=UPI000312A241|nr:hypothetical protein [Nocardia takedensis]
MSEDSGITARLAALSDAELVAVLRPVVAGRSGLWALRNVLEALAGVRDAELIEDVKRDTPSSATHHSDLEAAASGQVGTVFPVPAVPTGESAVTGTAPVGGYSPSGVPTFDSVRDKVERRFGTAQGMGELDRQTPAGRDADEQFRAREQAARERLDRIRESLHGKDE